MKNKDFRKILNDSPVVFAAKNKDTFEDALKSKFKVIFLLFGDICTIQDLVKQAKDHGKYIFVHIDLIEGMTSREVCVDFIHKYTDADGIISTRSRILKYAKKYELITVLRIFMLDSMALENSFHNIDDSNPDLIEILPGIATKSFSIVKEYSNLPIIAGGLIRTKQDICDAITAGATAISSSRFELGEVNQIIQQHLKDTSLA